jgi:hypothetical protein
MPDTTPAPAPTDDDYLLVRAGCDAYIANGLAPSDAFFAAVAKCQDVLYRTAQHLHLSDLPSDPTELIPPRTMRIAASWLLSN